MLFFIDELAPESGFGPPFFKSSLYVHVQGQKLAVRKNKSKV